MVEETKMNVFLKIFKSIGDFKAYKTFAKGKVGSAIFYLFIISLIFSIISLSVSFITLNEGVVYIKEDFMEKIPYFEFENGELTVHSDEPIIYEEDGGGIMIIDTTGEYDESALNDYEYGFFIGKDKIVQKENSIQTQTIDFSPLEELTFDKDTIEEYLYLVDVIFIVGMIIAFIFKFIGYIIVALWFSIIALIVNSALKAKLPYLDLLKLSIHAITLPALIGSICSFIGITIPFFGGIYHAIVVFYLYKAIIYIKEDEHRNNYIEIEGM